MWKVGVQKSWAEIGLEKFCIQVGIDFNSAFKGSLDSCPVEVDPYLLYRWVITENSQIPNGVLHLVPPVITDLPTLWEEWFLDGGKLHHHVLRNHRHDLATDVWLGEPTDTQHPRQVLGVQWHHSNDTDMRPVNFR